MTDKNQEALDDALNSDTAPDTNAHQPKMRRVNKNPLILVGAIVGTSLLTFMIFNNSNGGHTKVEIQDEKGDNADKALEGRLKNLPLGIIEKQVETPPLPQNGFVPPKEEASAPVAPVSFTPPAPVITSNESAPQLNGNEDQLKQQIEQQKAQLLQQAASMPSSVAFQMPENSKSSDKEDNQALTNADMPTFDPAEHPALPDKEREKRWGIETEKKNQTSPYTLRTGFVIPAVLTVAMNSDVPGQTQAIVSQNVYDTKTGKYLLIPQGAKLIGSYQSAPNYGSKRLSVLWERILFPDGFAMDIGGMQGTDFTGMNGLHDQVNNHWWRTLTSAFLMSIMQAPSAMGGALSLAGTGTGNSMMSNIASGGGQAAQMTASQTGSSLSQIFSRDLNTSPTLIIRSGYPLNIMVNKDLVFKSAYRA